MALTIKNKLIFILLILGLLWANYSLTQISYAGIIPDKTSQKKFESANIRLRSRIFSIKVKPETFIKNYYERFTVQSCFNQGVNLETWNPKTMAIQPRFNTKNYRVKYQQKMLFWNGEQACFTLKFLAKRISENSKAKLKLKVFLKSQTTSFQQASLSKK